MDSKNRFAALAAFSALLIAACAGAPSKDRPGLYVAQGAYVENEIDSVTAAQIIGEYKLANRSGEQTIRKMKSDKNEVFRINIINPPNANARIGTCRWLIVEKTDAGLFVKEKGPCWDQF